MAQGELSGIIQLGDKFVILKCDGRTEPVEVNPQEVRDILYQDLFEKKLRMAMNDKFAEIRSQARIDNYLAGTSQAPERVRSKADPEQEDAERHVPHGYGGPAGQWAGTGDARSRERQVSVRERRQ